MQNDDWNRTTSVARFLHGDFSLLPVTATTFYTQGFLGALFSLIFGISKLPILTLIVSVLNFFIFALILNKFFNFSKFTSAVLGLILFFNPLHMYSTIGFMTENYTMLMVLTSLLFFLTFEKSNEYSHLALSNLFSVLAFFCKQNGIVLLTSTLIYLLTKKKYKVALIQLVTISLTLLFYFLVFPQTQEMMDKGLIFEHLQDSLYSFSLIYGILLVSTSFLINFAVQAVVNTFKNLSGMGRRKIFSIMAFLVATIALFITLNYFFKPGKISWEEYPYFENTFERTGFLPRTVQGTKYYFRGNFDLYKNWNLASTVLAALVIIGVVLYRKKLVNLYSIYVGGYLVLMVLTAIFFDRYILQLIPFLALFLLTVFDIRDMKVFRIISSLFAVFLIFFSLQLATDFVFTQNYIWSKSEALVSYGAGRNNIYATGAWKRAYGISPSFKYLFTFDSPSKNSDIQTQFKLVETHKVEYFGNIFVDPKIYFYERK